jgi:hypothetical protein
MGWFWGRVWLVLSLSLLLAVAARAQSLPLTPTPSGGHFEIALHARRTKASARAEQAAWLTVTLPLDRLALPRVAQQPVVPSPAPAAPASAQTAAPSVVQAPSPVAAPAPAAAPEPSGPLVSFQQLRALSDFSRRATVVALSVAGAAAERRRFDSLVARARGSALLPELRLRAVRNTDQALRWVPTTDDPYRVTQADGAGMILEASATFRLDRLLFAHEELTAEGLRLRAGEARLKLEARVQGAVLGLFRARELGCSGERDDQNTLEVVKVVELFAELDNLTAGWFSDQAASFGRAVWGFPEAVLGVCSAPEPASAQAATNPVASLENSE